MTVIATRALHLSPPRTSGTAAPPSMRVRVRVGVRVRIRVSVKERSSTYS